MYFTTNFDDATVNVSKVLNNSNFENKDLTWAELSDTQKQLIAAEFVKSDVFISCNQLIDSILNDTEHEYYENVYNVAFEYNYFQTLVDYFYDLSFYELYEILQDFTCETISNKNIIDHIVDINALNKIEVLSENTNYILDQDQDELVRILQDNDIEIKKEFLENLLIKSKDNEDLCNDLGLDPIVEENYEYYIVTPFFKRMIGSCDEILDFTIWGRSTTGQSICLDHDIQKAAFCIYSNYSYECY